MKKNLLIPLLCLLSLFSKAQPKLSWTWMHGDQSYTFASSYGIRKVASPDNKPPGRNFSTSWTDKDGNFWMFGGGEDYAAHMYNDLWKFNPATNQWTWMNGDTVQNKPVVYGTMGVASPQNNPGARIFASSWMDKDGNMWLFGGYYYYGGSDYHYLNDMWKYDPLTDMWTWVKGSNPFEANSVYGIKGVANINTTPGASRNGNCWTDKNGNFWLFGGFTFASNGHVENSTNLLWKYDPLVNTWTWIKGDTANFSPVYSTQGVASPTNTPGGMLQSNTWVDSSGNFWMFGGYPGTGIHALTNFTNELWKYDPVADMWTFMKGNKCIDPYPTDLLDWPAVYGIKDSADINNMPGSRAYCASWTYRRDDNLWLFGGFGCTNADFNTGLGDLNDVWKYNITTNTWTWVKGDSLINQPGNYGTKGIADTLNDPSGRQYSLSWVDTTGNYWLFGGRYLNDMWKLSSSDYNHHTELRIWAEVVQDDNIRVSWETTREVYTDHFILEKGADRHNFSDLYTIAAAGNSTTAITYSFIDTHPLMDTNFYRVRIVNMNGSFSYSDIVAIKIKKDTPVVVTPGIYVIYPNPATNTLDVHLAGNNEPVTLQVYDAIGRLVKEEEFVLNGTINHKTDIRNLPKAMYTLVLRSNKRFYKESFIKL